MKNWILWFVLTLVSVGAGVTFFVLWYKEKKKEEGRTAVPTMGTNSEVVLTSPAPPAPPTSEPVLSESFINVGGRTVSQVLPNEFGS